MEWERKHQSAINTLLNQITNPPLLAYPDFSKPFIFHTDASGQGIGCALYRYQNDELRVLGYGSRTLVGAETKYHSSKLEFLALKWSICEHFRDYLFYANHFDVYAEFNPLVYLKSSCKRNATGQRWINEMTDYHFSIHYKPGTENKVADSLSRFPIQSQIDMSEYKEVVYDEEIKAVFNGSVNQSENGESWIPVVNTVKCSIDGDDTQFLYGAGESLYIPNCDEIVNAQDEERWIKVVMICLQRKQT